MARRKPTIWAIMCHCFLVLIVSHSSFAVTYTVDDDGPADFSSIQEAINNSFFGYTILVYPGTYNEKINFFGRAITVTGTDPNDMNTVQNTVIDGGGNGNVVYFNNAENDTSLLLGITIQNGDTGMKFYYSNPQIAKCVVRDNYSGLWGNNASPTIRDCVVEDNSGTGIISCNGEIDGCVIRNNPTGIDNCNGVIKNSSVTTASTHGMRNCNNEIDGCIVYNNGTSGLADCDGIIHNSVIAGNTSGFYNCMGTISNCTIIGNSSGYTGTQSGGHVIIENCIITKNQTYGINNERNPNDYSFSLSYNNVWNNIIGDYHNVDAAESDISVPPLFAFDGYWDNDNNWINGDYHLMSEAGRYDPCDDSWIIDSFTSSCIDAGDPNADIGQEPNPNGGKINQGAYGGTIYASKSAGGPEPYCAEYIPGDANLDCRINLQDIAMIASRWLECNLVPAEACWE